MTTRDAPFGTLDTPNVRMKIVGGKPVLVKDDPNYRKDHVTVQQPPPQLGPLVGSQPKRSNFHPPPAPGHARNAYQNAQQDSLGPIRNVVPPTSSGSDGVFNPHKVIPPITPQEQPRAHSHPQGQGQSQGQGHPGAPEHLPPININIHKYLPRDNHLPDFPIHLNKRDELELRDRLNKELVNFDVRKLQDIYLELTGFDKDLSGTVEFKDLSFILMKFQVHLSAQALRLVSALYMSLEQPGKINYEKVLSFLSAAVKPPPSPPRQPPPAEAPEYSPRGGKFYNPVTHENLDFSSTSEKFPFHDRENAKLLRMVQTQMADFSEDLDLHKVYQAFQRADRANRNVLSREQIVDLAIQCRIPLQEKIMNQIINKCDSSNGQYNWQQFVQFLEKVAPSGTGLNIPVSKRPLEYARQYPQPTENWPQVQSGPSPRDAPAGVPSYGHFMPKPHQPQYQPAEPSPRPGAPPGPQWQQHQPAPAPAEMPQQPSMSQPHQNNHTQPPHHRQPSPPPMVPSPRLDRQPFPDVDPMDDLELGHPRLERLKNIEQTLQKQQMIDSLEKELKRLEGEYEITKHKMVEDEQQLKKAADLMPWFDRFMKLANALYSNDSSNTGRISQKEAQWLINQYNFSYQLNLAPDYIDSAVKRTLKGDKVELDPLLKILSNYGP